QSLAAGGAGGAGAAGSPAQTLQPLQAYQPLQGGGYGVSPGPGGGPGGMMPRYPPGMNVGGGGGGGGGGGAPRPLDQVTCFKCKQRGHYANHCPNRHVM
ncbi:hypothetical protein CXG81DRAFT_24550, partial [Caulochytrium protostelioides]